MDRIFVDSSGLFFGSSWTNKEKLSNIITITRVNDTTVKILANFNGVFESHGLLSGENYSMAMRTKFSTGVEQSITNYNGRSFMNYDPIIFYIQDSNNYNVGGMVVTQTFTKIKIHCSAF